jgi:hypothetical protein
MNVRLKKLQSQTAKLRDDNSLSKLKERKDSDESPYYY